MKLLASVLCSAALAAQAKPPADPDAVLAHLREATQRLLSEQRRQVQTADGMPWDVSLRAATLGDDPAAHLAFVRDKVALEPYPGIQRGPSGTLVAKAGNPADRAFLLAELLRARGLRARVVRAELSEAGATQILAAALEAMRARKPVTVTPFGRGECDPAKVAARCEAVGLAANEVQQLLTQRATDRDLRWTEVLDFTWREARFLAEQFGEPAVPARDLHADALQWLRTHYWVQVQGADPDSWRDLDPSFPGLASDAKVTEAVPDPIDPQDIADRLRFVVSMERTVDGQPETVTLLDQEVAVHATLLRPVRFMILPEKGYERLAALVGKADVAEVRAAVAACDRYQAVLMAGQETLGSKVFDRQGGYFAVAANGSLIGANEKLQGVVDLFSGAAEEKAKTKLSRLRVRVSCEREGRELWGRARDLTPPPDVAQWLPSIHWSAFAHNFDLSHQALAAIERRYFVEHSSVFAAVMAGRSVDGAPIKHYPGALLQFALARGAQAAITSRALVFEHTDLLLASNRIVLTAQGQLAVERGIDLMANDALAVAAGERLQIDRAATSELGVFDTVTEQVLLRSTQQVGATSGVLVPMERARLQGDRPLVLAASDSAGLAAANVAASDVAWIAEHAAPNERALCLAKAPGVWWSQDASTGRTVGRLAGGRGGCVVRSESAESLVILKPMIEAAVCIGVAQAKVVTGTAGWLDVGQLAVCMFGVVAGAGNLVRLDLALTVLGGLLDIEGTVSDAAGGY